MTTRDEKVQQCKYCREKDQYCPFIYEDDYVDEYFNTVYEEVKNDPKYNHPDFIAETDTKMQMELINIGGPIKWHKIKQPSGNDYSKSGNKYFITLSSCPTINDPNVYYQAIQNILKQKCFKSSYGYGCIELTKKGEPHAHIYMECKAYVKLAKLKRQWKHSSIDVKSIKKDNGIINYIDKDENNKALNDFLEKHDCKRTYIEVNSLQETEEKTEE